MEGIIDELDLGWEREIENMDWVVEGEEIKSVLFKCIEELANSEDIFFMMDGGAVEDENSGIRNFSNQDIIWASTALEREGTNFFDTKLLDSWSSNDEHSDKIQKKVPKEEEYYVEKIVSKRLKDLSKKGEAVVPSCPEDFYEYQVKWEGYKPEENTWEPYANVSHCTEDLERLYQKLERKKRSKRTKSRVATGQRKTKRNSHPSGKSQECTNNNNFEHFYRDAKEQQCKRKRVKQEQDDVPEAKRRKTTKAVSSLPTRTLPKRNGSSSRI